MMQPYIHNISKAYIILSQTFYLAMGTYLKPNSSTCSIFFSHTDTDEFSSSSSAHRDNLLDAFAKCIIDQDAGLAPASIQKQTGCFDRWIRFLADMGIEDEFLEKYSRKQRQFLISAFSTSCRRINMVNKAKPYSKEALSNPPSRMFVRPFGRIFGQTQL